MYLLTNSPSGRVRPLGEVAKRYISLLCAQLVTQWHAAATERAAPPAAGYDQDARLGGQESAPQACSLRSRYVEAACHSLAVTVAGALLGLGPSKPQVDSDSESEQY